MTRKYGTGTVYERKNRRGQVIGFRGQQSLGGETRSYRSNTRREVQRQMDEERAAFMQGRLTPKQSPTVETFLTEWLETMRVNRTVRPRTLESYESKCRLYLIPNLGTHRLGKLKPGHIQECYNVLSRQGLSAQTIRHAHRTLHRALDGAVRLDHLLRNPSDLVELPRVQRVEMHTLTAKQVDALFASTCGDRFHPLWVLLATTGLRIGEAMGLRWEDIDLTKGRLTVHRALQRQRGGNGLVFVPPKSATSRRTVELSELACQALREHKERQAFEERKAGTGWEENDLVFCTCFGGPMAPEHIKRHLDAALKKAGLPHIRIHDMRHTAATLLLHELGLPVKLVSEMLGHSGIGITLSTYGHVIPGMHREAAERMGQLFTRSEASG